LDLTQTETVLKLTLVLICMKLVVQTIVSFKFWNITYTTTFLTLEKENHGGSVPSNYPDP